MVFVAIFPFNFDFHGCFRMDKSLRDKMLEGRIVANKRWEEEKQRFISENTIQIRNYFLGIPDRYKKIYVRASMGKSTRSDAIKAKCLDCSAWNKEEIRHCKVYTCPLHKFRPYKEKE